MGSEVDRSGAQGYAAMASKGMVNCRLACCNPGPAGPIGHSKMSTLTLPLGVRMEE